MPPLHALYMDPVLKPKIKDLRVHLFTEADQVVVEGLITMLEPFKRITEDLSGDFFKNIVIKSGSRLVFTVFISSFH